jgi:acetoin utilization protein AcuB
MVRNVIALQAGQRLREALLIMRKHSIRHLPVLEEGKLVGILTDRDVTRATPSAMSGADLETFNHVVDSTLIKQVMTRNPYAVTPSTPLRDAVKVLHDRKYGALPVVEGGRLVGIITVMDLLKDFMVLLPE